MAAPAAEAFGHVVVIGGCGCLGSHIVRQLAEEHTVEKISVIDLTTSRNRIAGSGIGYYDGDITSAASLRTLFEKLKPEVVIHTVSPTLVGAGSDKAIAQKVNVEGTRNLLKVSVDTGVKAFVYTSSASVVADTNKDTVNATEDWPYVPRKKQDVYSATKTDAERMVLRANRVPSSFLTCSLRPAGLMGEGDAQMVPQMIKAWRKGQHRFQLGENENLFDFTYAGNAAYAHILAAAALLATHRKGKAEGGEDAKPWVPPADMRVDGEAFHVTNDSPVYFWDFPRMVWRAAEEGTSGSASTTTDKRTVKPLPSPWIIPQGWALVLATIFEWVFWIFRLGKPNLTRREVAYSCITRYYSCEKAKLRLAYRPLVPLDEAIKRGVTWCLANEQLETVSAGEKKQQ